MSRIVVLGALLLLVAGLGNLWNAPGALAVSTEESSASQGARVGVDVERVYPRLRFQRPVFLTHAGDGSGRVFVVEQHGVVHVVPDAEDPVAGSVFLDISDRVSRIGNEEGLIGLAFHPRFEENGTFFVHYSSSAKDRTGVVSRFRVAKDDPNRADPKSEEVILEQPQPYRNHNGGMIEFGPDGFLYIAFGDGGSANDPNNNAQNLTNWLGTILRIDLDRKEAGRAYAVPEDNPFVGREDARPEIWAYGLRNVWRFCFDPENGDLIAADVGQDRFEEIDLIEKGGNHGWRAYEGDHRFFRRTRIPPEEHVIPIAEYGRSDGISVTGGFIYRGSRHPALAGRYFYGDYVSGNLWSLERDAKGEWKSTLERRTGKSIASFGMDEDGEIYLLSFDGGVYRITASNEPVADPLAGWPEKLSETRLFASVEGHVPAGDLIPYEVNVGFWSDRAQKKRYIHLPRGGKIGFRAEGPWELPVGATIVKTFIGNDFGRERILETRLIKRTAEGWEAASYMWDRDQKEARLVPEGSQFELIHRGGVDTWHVPSVSECAACHTDSAGFVLGLTTAQLNRPGAEGGTNQLVEWSARRLLDPPVPDASKLPRLASAKDESRPIGARARAWLDVNCAMCHRPDGPGNAAIDLRYETSIADTGTLDVPPAQGDLGLPNARIVAPGAPGRSVLVERVRTLGAGRMPNLASNLVDSEGVELLERWIATLKRDR